MNKKNKLKTFIERNKKSNGYLLRKTSFNVFYKISRFVLLFGLCFMMLWICTLQISAERTLVRSRNSCNRCSSYNNSGFLVPEFPIL